MSKPLTIVVDARYLDSGFSGIGDYSANLLEALARIDRENQYRVLVHAGFDRSLKLSDNYQLHPIGAAPLSLATVFQLQSVVRSFKPDLFHAHFPVAPLFNRTPTVVTVHDLQPLQMAEWTGGRPWPIPALHRGFYHWLYPRVFNQAAALATVSHATRDTLVERFPQHAAKTIAVPSGFAPDASPPDAEAIWRRLAAQFRLPERFILYLGSSRPNKNLSVMLDAFARLARLDPAYSDLAFVLLLAPDRFRPEVDRAVAALKIADRVRILPQVAEAEKRVLLERARALFFATRLEGFGIPVLEAQAAGTPVLVSTADALPETAGEGALLVPADDPAGMAVSLREILSDQELRHSLVARGRANLARFDWDAAARKMLEIYAAAVSART